MTQDEAKQLYNAYRQIVEQQTKDAIELAKLACNLRQQQYGEQLKEERNLGEQATLKEKISAAAVDRDTNIQNIEADAASRLAATEKLLRENVEQAKQMEAKWQDDKVKQDIELRNKELSNEEHQKERDKLDKLQEKQKHEMQNEQSKADKLLEENIQKDLRSKETELEKQRQALERQRELEQQKKLEEQNRNR